MGLLDDVQAHARGVRKGPQCSVGALPSDLLAEVNEALAARNGTTVTYRGITEALERRGVAGLTHHTLGRHARGDCACEPAG